MWYLKHLPAYLGDTMEKQLAQGDKDMEILIRQWQPKEMKDRNWTSANYFWWKIQKEERYRRQSYNWLRPTWQRKNISSRVSMLTRRKGWHNRAGGVPMASIYSDIKKPLQHAGAYAKRPYGNSHCGRKEERSLGFLV